MKTSSSSVRLSHAHDWFQRHYTDLTNRCHGHFHYLRHEERYEVVAETLAQIFRYILRAQQRGKLEHLTPYTLVVYFGRLCAQGRRLAGYSSTDALFRGTGRKRRNRVISLDQPRRIHTRHGEVVMPLSEILADSRTGQPDENARIDLDYIGILNRQEASPRARRLFQYLCQTHGEGQLSELADEFGVHPGQITRSREELAACLAAEDYLPPATRSGGQPVRRRGRPRKLEVPLNAGTTPARADAISGRIARLATA